MSTHNPYAAPQTELTGQTDRYDPPGGLELATRGSRFVAAMVDGVVGIVYTVPISYANGVWGYVQLRQLPPARVTVVAGVCSLIAYCLIHGYFLKKNGQTIGKKLLGVRIANLNGAVPGFWTLILRRYLPMVVVANIPPVGLYVSLLDTLFIFRGDRRCIHDLIAGTRVVKIKATGKHADRINRWSPPASTDWMLKKPPQ